MLFLITSVTCLIVPVISRYHGDSNSCDDRISPRTCTPLSECKPLMEEIRAAGRPMPLHLSRKLNDLGCGYNSEEPLVCCPSRSAETSQPSFNIPTVDINPYATWDSKGNRPQVNSNAQDFDSEPEDVSNHPNLSLLPRNCGTIDSNRIVGGNRTQLYEMPWMVLLSYDDDGVIKLGCGGTLINEWYVLTAAHCVQVGSRMTLSHVILGEYDLRTDPDCEVLAGKKTCAPRAVNVSIEEVISHPGYRRQTLFDDIALLRLSTPANFDSDSVSPICLPFTRDRQLDNLDGLFGVVAGWGLTEQHIQADVLLSVPLPVIPNDECQEDYGSPRIYKRQLCAGGVRDKDSCGGDSGGPLMYPGVFVSGGVRYVQRGIVSFGPKRCGVGGLPGVYTRVAYYMKWILDNMRS